MGKSSCVVPLLAIAVLLFAQLARTGPAPSGATPTHEADAPAADTTVPSAEVQPTPTADQRCTTSVPQPSGHPKQIPRKNGLGQQPSVPAASDGHTADPLHNIPVPNLPRPVRRHDGTSITSPDSITPGVRLHVTPPSQPTAPPRATVCNPPPSGPPGQPPAPDDGLAAVPGTSKGAAAHERTKRPPLIIPSPDEFAYNPQGASQTAEGSTAAPTDVLNGLGSSATTNIARDGAHHVGVLGAHEQVEVPVVLDSGPNLQHGDREERRINLAAAADGASIIGANKEARKPEKTIDGDDDSYMKNHCPAHKWLILELSQLGRVDEVQLLNKEMYSSRVKDFTVKGRQSHPRKDGPAPEFVKYFDTDNWQLLGNFTAANKKGEQLFRMQTPRRVRYLLFQFHTHYGSEEMCALNSITVLGVSAAQELEEALAAQLNSQVSTTHTNTNGKPAPPPSGAGVGTPSLSDSPTTPTTSQLGSGDPTKISGSLHHHTHNVSSTTGGASGNDTPLPHTSTTSVNMTQTTAITTPAWMILCDLKEALLHPHMVLGVCTTRSGASHAGGPPAVAVHDKHDDDEDEDDYGVGGYDEYEDGEREGSNGGGEGSLGVGGGNVWTTDVPPGVVDWQDEEHLVSGHVGGTSGRGTSHTSGTLPRTPVQPAGGDVSGHVRQPTAQPTPGVRPAGEGDAVQAVQAGVPSGPGTSEVVITDGVKGVHGGEDARPVPNVPRPDPESRTQHPHHPNTVPDPPRGSGGNDAPRQTGTAPPIPNPSPPSVTGGPNGLPKPAIPHSTSHTPSTDAMPPSPGSLPSPPQAHIPGPDALPPSLHKGPNEPHTAGQLQGNTPGNLAPPNPQAPGEGASGGASRVGTSSRGVAGVHEGGVNLMGKAGAWEQSGRMVVVVPPEPVPASVLDSLITAMEGGPASKPKQAGNLFDIFKQEFVLLRLNQTRMWRYMTSLVEVLNKNAAEAADELDQVEVSVAALEGRLAALPGQLEASITRRLVHKYDQHIIRLTNNLNNLQQEVAQSRQREWAMLLYCTAVLALVLSFNMYPTPRYDIQGGDVGKPSALGRRIFCRVVMTLGLINGLIGVLLHSPKLQHILTTLIPSDILGDSR